MDTSQYRRRADSRHRQLHDYIYITVAMMLGTIGWSLFLLPNEIPMGGLTGIASIVYWGTGIPAQYVYFALNAALLIAALIILGWRFCVKTIYAVVIFTLMVTVLRDWVGDLRFFADQKFMATIVGGVFMGTSVGLGLSAGGSTGGSDVIAAMVHKYRDVSLGHVILFCDLAIITSSYIVLRDWEKVFYGYVLLFVLSFFVDYVVNSMRRSVQFFIVSDKWKEIGEAINKIADRGCSTINGNGFYTQKDIKIIFCIAKKNESGIIFDLIDEIDPNAFVAQSAAIGVYGKGFDRFKVRKSSMVKAGVEELQQQEKQTGDGGHGSETTLPGK